MLFGQDPHRPRESIKQQYMGIELLELCLQISSQRPICPKVPMSTPGQYSTLWVILKGRAAGPSKIDGSCLRSGPSPIQEFEALLIDKGFVFPRKCLHFPTWLHVSLMSLVYQSDTSESAIAAANRSSQGEQRGGKQRQQTTCTGGMWMMWMVCLAPGCWCITFSWRDSVPLLRGRPGHGNGMKVAEVQASMSRLHAASLFRRKTRICQSFGTMPFFILEISARWNLLCTVISKMKFPRWICILYHCAPMGLPSNFMATTHCCRCHRTCTAKKKTACW